MHWLIRFPGAPQNRGIKDDVVVSGVLRDASLGNNGAAFSPVRAALAEMEWIDHADVDAALNTGGDAATNREAIAEALADAIIDDLQNQP